MNSSPVNTKPAADMGYVTYRKRTKTWRIHLIYRYFKFNFPWYHGTLKGK